jgi:hypothetical protein
MSVHSPVARWLVIVCQTFVKIGPACIPVGGMSNMGRGAGNVFSITPNFERGGGAILVAAG